MAPRSARLLLLKTSIIAVSFAGALCLFFNLRLILGSSVEQVVLNLGGSERFSLLLDDLASMIPPIFFAGFIKNALYSRFAL